MERLFFGWNEAIQTSNEHQTHIDFGYERIIINEIPIINIQSAADIGDLNQTIIADKVKAWVDRKKEEKFFLTPDLVIDLDGAFSLVQRLEYMLHKKQIMPSLFRSLMDYSDGYLTSFMQKSYDAVFVIDVDYSLGCTNMIDIENRMQERDNALQTINAYLEKNKKKNFLFKFIPLYCKNEMDIRNATFEIAKKIMYLYIKAFNN